MYTFSFSESFPKIDSVFVHFLDSLHAVHLLDVLLLLGLIAFLYIYVWELLMVAVDFLLSIFVLPFSVGRFLTATLGYYLICSLIVAAVGVWQTGTQHLLAVIAGGLTMFALAGWDAYERYVPTSQEEITVSAFVRWLNLMLAPFWTAVCVATLLGHQLYLLPLSAVFFKYLAVMDSFALLGLLLRFIGMFVLAQTFIRGAFSLLGMLEFAQGKMRNGPPVKKIPKV